MPDTAVAADESPAAGALSGDTVVAAASAEVIPVEFEGNDEQTQEIRPLFTPAATAGDPPTNGAVAAAAGTTATADSAVATAPEAVADFPAGAARSLPDGSSPGPDYTIKGNTGSKRFHLPASPYFQRTKAEMWFRTADEARAAGFTEWAPRKRAKGSGVTR